MVEKQLFDMVAPFEEGISARFEEEETDELTKSINKARGSKKEVGASGGEAARKSKKGGRRKGARTASYGEKKRGKVRRRKNMHKLVIDCFVRL